LATYTVGSFYSQRKFPCLFSEADPDVRDTDLQVTPLSSPSSTVLHGVHNNPYRHVVVGGGTVDRQVSVEEAEAVAAAWGVPYVEVSSKTGEGTEAALCALVEAAIVQQNIEGGRRGEEDEGARMRARTAGVATPTGAGNTVASSIASLMLLLLLLVFVLGVPLARFCSCSVRHSSASC
jgi:hypothetical protein